METAGRGQSATRSACRHRPQLSVASLVQAEEGVTAPGVDLEARVQAQVQGLLQLLQDAHGSLGKAWRNEGKARTAPDTVARLELLSQFEDLCGVLHSYHINSSPQRSHALVAVFCYTDFFEGLLRALDFACKSEP
eukprot:211648-Amphidinium_carterae.1